MNFIRLLPLTVVLAAAWTSPARADTLACTQVSTFPATLAAQGVYCLKQSHVLGNSPGPAIKITANNVTLDCNGNQLRQTGGAIGISVTNVQNVTIRNCVLTGFVTGIDLSGSGNLVEDNRIVGVRDHGMIVKVGPNVVRRNFVSRVGGVPGTTFPSGISAENKIDLLDNTIAGVASLAGTGQAGIGMSLTNVSGEISGNRIWGVSGDGAGQPVAIAVISGTALGVRGNDLLTAAGGTGVACYSMGDTVTFGNWLVGFNTPTNNCFSINNQVY